MSSLRRRSGALGGLNLSERRANLDRPRRPHRDSVWRAAVTFCKVPHIGFLAMGFRRSGKFATGYAIVNDLVGFKNKALFFREVS
jgi:hypothetical protein